MKPTCVKHKVKLTTFGNYQGQVQASIAPWVRDKGVFLSELTANNINDFYEYHYSRGISVKTVLKPHANIVSALHYVARKEDIISADSILKNVYRPDADDYMAKPYNESEAVALIEAVKGHKLELPVIIGVFYGLRRAEVVGLHWESIDFEANTIEHSVTVAKIDGSVLLYLMTQPRVNPVCERSRLFR